MRIAIGESWSITREGREPARSVVINQEGHAKFATLSALSEWPPSKSMLLQSIDRSDMRATKRENHSANTIQEKILLVWASNLRQEYSTLVTISTDRQASPERGIINSRLMESNGNTSTGGSSNEGLEGFSIRARIIAAAEKRWFVESESFGKQRFYQFSSFFDQKKSYCV